jgi:hypothetical protein
MSQQPDRTKYGSRGLYLPLASTPSLGASSPNKSQNLFITCE